MEKPLLDYIPARLRGRVATFSVLMTPLLTIATICLGWLANRTEARLKEAELRLKERASVVEESRERVERYKWVFSLLPSLSDQDPARRQFTVALARLALSPDEASQLFAALEASDNPQWQLFAKQAQVVLRREIINSLLHELGSEREIARQQALKTLLDDYLTSGLAVKAATLFVSQAEDPSPQALVNYFYFLARTDPSVWSESERRLMANYVSSLKNGSKPRIGPQALREANSLLERLGMDAKATPTPR